MFHIPDTIILFVAARPRSKRTGAAYAAPVRLLSIIQRVKSTVSMSRPEMAFRAFHR